MQTAKSPIHLLLLLLLLLLPMLLGSSLALAQDGDSGGPPLDEPRIERVEKPWTEAQREILEPRERNGRVVGHL